MAELIRNLQLNVLDIIANNNGSYILDIQSELLERLDKKYSLGAIITTLDRLAANEFVTFTKSGIRNMPGGRPRRYYKITITGKEALESRVGCFTSIRGSATPLVTAFAF